MNSHDSEIVLIGGGVMSLTLAMILKELDSSLNIAVYEKLEDVALESSMVWNNAGTGHQALCELNYTPENADGSIQTTKAFAINQLYELSKEFYAHCIRKGLLKAPETFINPLPHISFVFDGNVPFLKKRYEQLSASPLFKNMLYTENHEQIKEWAPLLINGRESNQRVAATLIEGGTDVDFGEMVHQLRDSLSKMSGFAIFTNHKAIGLDKRSNGWDIRFKDTKNGTIKTVRTKFVFLGAGGGAFPLLQKSGIPEGKGYSGFPVGGLWLICKNQEIVEQHNAKVYGKASLGAPPMSLPHLDTRIIHGKKHLLFGPYAGFNTKFLKYGSWLDFPLSMRSDNWLPMLEAGMRNTSLTLYLIKQVLMGKRGRMKKLDQYVPNANIDDWTEQFAGQRVQVIRRDASGHGDLQFGTEVITSSDGTLAALLGASPGASTAVDIMLQVVRTCFKERFQKDDWEGKLREMLPSYGFELEEHIKHFNDNRSKTAETLKIPFVAI